VGLITLALALVAMRTRGRSGLELFFVLLAGVAFGAAYVIPPVFNVVQALPGFSVTANFRAVLLLAFALCVLAGRGVDILLGAPAADVRRTLVRVRAGLLLALTLVGLVTPVLVVAALSYREELVDAAQARIAAALARRSAELEVSDVLAVPIEDYYQRFVKLLVREGSGRFVLLALSALVLHLATSAVVRRHHLAWMLPAVLLLDLFSFGRNYNPPLEAPVEYPPAPSIDFLRAQPGLFRVLTVHGDFPPNTNLMYGLSEIRGYDSLETVAYQRFLAATGDYPQPNPHFRTLYFSNVGSRLIDVLNVKYVLSDRALYEPKLALVWDGPTRVYENRAAKPRAFLVHRTRVLSQPGDMERLLRAPDFDPTAVALFDRAGPALSAPADPLATATITIYLPESVVVRVASQEEAVLILADAWFPGWRAVVDGAEATVWAANGFLRAVRIPAGEHEVVFTYDPVSFRLGWLLTAGAAGLAATLALVTAWRHLPARRRRVAAAATTLTRRGSAGAGTEP
jgi:hypothetical protein